MKKSGLTRHGSNVARGATWGKQVVVIMLVSYLTACGGGGSEPPATSGSTLSGTLQKGAFQIGASITAQELDSSANPTSNSVNGSVTNNLGAYTLSTSWSGWTKLTVSGAFFDEYNGSVNTTPITLNSIQQIEVGDISLNVNMFTHFVAARTTYRVQNNSENISTAKEGAEGELQKALNLAAVDADQLDIHEGEGTNSNANATLLLFSGSFMATGGDTASLANLVSDFQLDGRFEIANLQGIATEAEKPGMMARLTNNLVNSGVSNPPDTEDIQQIPDWTNSPPVANDVNVNANEDTPQTITLQGTDADNDELSYIKLSEPQHGAVTFSGAVATYTPSLNFNGTDSFTYKVNDGVVDSEPAIVTINVGSSNDAPTAESKTATTDEDQSVEIALTGSDPEGDSLNFSKVTDPSYGSVSIAGNTVIYTPDENENSGDLIGDSGANLGNDSFTIKANDGAADSDPVTITVTVNPINDAPIPGGFGNLQNTDEDTPLTFNLPGYDPDNLFDSLTASITTEPEHGQVSVVGKKVVYAPDADYNGIDSFYYTLSDGKLTSAPFELGILVDPVNDAPIADAGSDVQVIEGKTVTLDASNSSTGPDNDSINYSWSPADNLDSAIKVQPVFTAPAVIADTEQTLTLTVTDSGALSDSDTVKITILNLPGQPQNVQAEKGDGEVTVSWDEVSDATSYDICMASESISDPENCASLQDGQLFSDQESPSTISALTNNTTYYFVVIPKNTHGNGVVSSQVNEVPSKVETGTLSPAIKGLQYRTATQSGYLNEASEYKFLPGEIIKFYIDDVLLGWVYGGKTISISHFDDANYVMSFLLSVDTDPSIDFIDVSKVKIPNDIFEEDGYRFFDVFDFQMLDLNLIANETMNINGVSLVNSEKVGEIASLAYAKENITNDRENPAFSGVDLTNRILVGESPSKVVRFSENEECRVDDTVSINGRVCQIIDNQLLITEDYDPENGFFSYEILDKNLSQYGVHYTDGYPTSELGNIYIGSQLKIDDLLGKVYELDILFEECPQVTLYIDETLVEPTLVISGICKEDPDEQFDYGFFREEYAYAVHSVNGNVRIYENYPDSFDYFNLAFIQGDKQKGMISFLEYDNRVIGSYGFFSLGDVDNYPFALTDRPVQESDLEKYNK